MSIDKLAELVFFVVFYTCTCRILSTTKNRNL